MDFLIHHMLRHSTAQHPEKEALVHGPRRLTYREVGDRCASLAYGLRGAGMQRGDRVGIYLDPSIEQVLSIFSISQAGGVYVPINTVLVPDQVAHIARDCGMKALITTPEKLEILLPALHDVSVAAVLRAYGQIEWTGSNRCEIGFQARASFRRNAAPAGR